MTNHVIAFCVFLSHFVPLMLRNAIIISFLPLTPSLLHSPRTPSPFPLLPLYPLPLPLSFTPPPSHFNTDHYFILRYSKKWDYLGDNTRLNDGLEGEQNHTIQCTHLSPPIPPPQPSPPPPSLSSLPFLPHLPFLPPSPPPLSINLYLFGVPISKERQSPASINLHLKDRMLYELSKRRQCLGKKNTNKDTDLRQ